MSTTRAKTVAIASLTHVSSGPKRSSTASAAASTCSAQRHVGRHDERLTAELLDLAPRVFEALLAARHQPDVGTALGERVRDRAPDATRSPCHNHHFRLVAMSHC